MADGPVKHAFRATGLDGDPARELAVKIDSTYQKLDEFLEALLNDPRLAADIARNPEDTLHRFGIQVEGVAGMNLVLPNATAIRAGLGGDLPAVQPGVNVSTRASAGVALVEVAVAISLWVWAGIVGASGYCPGTRTFDCTAR